MAGLNPSGRRTKFGDCLICYNKYKTKPDGSGFDLKAFENFVKFFGRELSCVTTSWHSLPFCQVCVPNVEELSQLNYQLEEIQTKIMKHAHKINLKILESLESDEEYKTRAKYFTKLANYNLANTSKQHQFNALRNHIIQGAHKGFLGFQDLNIHDRNRLLKNLQNTRDPSSEKSTKAKANETNKSLSITKPHNPLREDYNEESESLHSNSSAEFKVEEFSPEHSVSSLHSHEEYEESLESTYFAQSQFEVEQSTIYGGTDIDADNSHDGIGVEVPESYSTQMGGSSSSSSQSSVLFGTQIVAVDAPSGLLSKSVPRIVARGGLKLQKQLRPLSQMKTESNEYLPSDHELLQLIQEAETLTAQAISDLRSRNENDPILKVMAKINFALSSLRNSSIPIILKLKTIHDEQKNMAENVSKCLNILEGNRPPENSATMSITPFNLAARTHEVCKYEKLGENGQKQTQSYKVCCRTYLRLQNEKSVQGLVRILLNDLIDPEILKNSCLSGTVGKNSQDNMNYRNRIPENVIDLINVVANNRFKTTISRNQIKTYIRNVCQSLRPKKISTLIQPGIEESQSSINSEGDVEDSTRKTQRKQNLQASVQNVTVEVPSQYPIYVMKSSFRNDIKINRSSPY